MPEVVSLLSSSPPRGLSISPKPSKRSSRPVQSSVFNAAFLDIGSSDFEDNIKAQPEAGLSKKSSVTPKLPSPTGSNLFQDRKVFDDSVLDNIGTDDFPVEQPAKRRRLRSSPLTTSVQLSKSIVDVDAVFDLSSEPGHDKEVVGDNDSNTIFRNAEISTHDEVDLPSFSSSAPQSKTSVAEEARPALVVDLSSDDDTPNLAPVISSSQPVGKGKQVTLSERTTNLLANLKPSSGKHLSVTKSSSVRQGGVHFKSTKRGSHTNTPEDEDKIIDSSQPAAKSSKAIKPNKSSEVTERKTSDDKTAEKLRKQREKDEAKEQKRLDKERLAAEKQLAADKAEVNRKKTDKKKTAEEMIVKMPYSIKGKSLGNQVEELMSQVEVETKYYQADVDMSNDDFTPVSHGAIIKFYRKVKSRYNHELEEYETTTAKTEQEKHILVYLTAEEFCALAAAGPKGHVPEQDGQTHPSEEEMKTNIDTYITLLRSKCEGVTLIFLIQGLTAYLKKSANTKNREYAASVRALNPEVNASTSSAPARPSKKRKSTTSQLDLSFLTTEHIDDLTLHLQLSHQPLHIHHTTSVATSAQQISAFTQHLSTRPYRLSEQAHNLAHASFCMASGQFRTGQGDVTETFLKMLEQVNRITPSMALGIVTEGYDTPRQLVEAFMKVERGNVGSGDIAGSSREVREAKEKARLMLQDVQKALNKNGARSDKRLGPAASKRLYKVFMSKDENLRDGIV